jgi:hypothetical protein
VHVDCFPKLDAAGVPGLIKHAQNDALGCSVHICVIMDLRTSSNE